MSRQLSRAEDATRSAAPVRIVHLGAGNFFRAHQAWYTHASEDAAGWGIAAFTGRSPTVSEQLAPQDFLYLLSVQHHDGDVNHVIESLSAVHPAGDHDAWLGYFRSPDVTVVTSTITEAGYLTGEDGGLAMDNPQIQTDIQQLRDGGVPSTAPGKFVAGLRARRDADAGPITFLPCDNVPHNGAMVRRVVTDMAPQVDEHLLNWIEQNVGFVTTMVDRITPRATDDDRERVANETGILDPALVVTEPFHEWLLSGEFAADRPAWESAGARFVDDITRFEQRKLWMLNGSHSLMAYAGPMFGHQYVASAIGDDQLRGWLDQWWDVACDYLELPDEELRDYRAALVHRFENSRMRHQLAQIAGDGSVKIPIRIVPVANSLDADGRPAGAATRVVAAWVCHLRGHGAPVNDANGDEFRQLAADQPKDLLARIGLAEALHDAVLLQADELVELST